MTKDKIIVGAIIISQVDFIDITIPNLLKFCNCILIIMDNESKETEEKIYEYQKKYYYRIFVRRSSMPHKLFTRNGKEINYHTRWKCIKSFVRNDVFTNLRIILNAKMLEKIDILLFPDADEMFTNFLPELLEKFWGSEYKAISLKHIHVVDDMQTIKDDKMQSHVHIFKWQDNLCGYPWQWRNQMQPITWDETMTAEYYSVHLCYLTEKMREWRNANWKNVDLKNDKLYKLNKSVFETRPEEIKNILNS